ncbi:hypothetical protein C8J56DRAFT_935317 [Mycena floridula]|nr:hypothetical protein C8J56DRAFT_935317 [Mycena floridula]
MAPSKASRKTGQQFLDSYFRPEKPAKKKRKSLASAGKRKQPEAEADEPRPVKKAKTTTPLKRNSTEGEATIKSNKLPVGSRLESSIIDLTADSQPVSTSRRQLAALPIPPPFSQPGVNRTILRSDSPPVPASEVSSPSPSDRPPELERTNLRSELPPAFGSPTRQISPKDSCFKEPELPDRRARDVDVVPSSQSQYYESFPTPSASRSRCSSISSESSNVPSSQSQYYDPFPVPSTSRSWCTSVFSATNLFETVQSSQTQERYGEGLDEQVPSSQSQVENELLMFTPTPLIPRQEPNDLECVASSQTQSDDEMTIPQNFSSPSPQFSFMTLDRGNLDGLFADATQPAVEPSHTFSQDTVATEPDPEYDNWLAEGMGGGVNVESQQPDVLEGQLPDVLETQLPAVLETQFPATLETQEPETLPEFVKEFNQMFEGSDEDYPADFPRSLRC